MRERAAYDYLAFHVRIEMPGGESASSGDFTAITISPRFHRRCRRCPAPDCNRFNHDALLRNGFRRCARPHSPATRSTRGGSRNSTCPVTVTPIPRTGDRREDFCLEPLDEGFVLGQDLVLLSTGSPAFLIKYSLISSGDTPELIGEVQGIDLPGQFRTATA